MARWFRSHTAKLDNPKAQRLAATPHRARDSLLCVADAWWEQISAMAARWNVATKLKEWEQGEWLV